MTAEQYFNELVSEIPGGKPGKMFGALSITMPNGKAGAMFWRDSLIVKLPEKQREEALKLKGATLFDPMGGRPMKEWVLVPFSQKERWKMFLKSSTTFVATASGNKPKASKSPVKPKSSSGSKTPKKKIVKAVTKSRGKK